VTALEILTKARELIATPDKWTQGLWKKPDAECYCLWGAVYRAAGGDATSREPPGFTLAWRLVTKQVNGGAITYNDLPSTTHADVLALLDRAIASC
jgi:hypothetical protein